MSKRKKFVSKKSRILALIKEGKSISEVAKAVGVTSGYVYHIRWTDLNKGKVKKAEKKESRLLKAMQETTAEIQKITRPTLTPDEFIALMKPVDSQKDRDPKNLTEAGEFLMSLIDKEAEQLKTPDLVNHPPHYKVGGIETIDFIEAKDLNFRLGNVVKYVARAGKKNSNPLEDLKKARWYLDREIFAREGA
jgi:transposase-like protein